MSFIEQCGVNGILADDMGLGKTLQTLCLLAMKVHDKQSAKVCLVSVVCLSFKTYLFESFVHCWCCSSLFFNLLRSGYL